MKTNSKRKQLRKLAKEDWLKLNEVHFDELEYLNTLSKFYRKQIIKAENEVVDGVIHTYKTIDKKISYYSHLLMDNDSLLYSLRKQKENKLSKYTKLNAVKLKYKKGKEYRIITVDNKNVIEIYTRTRGKSHIDIVKEYKNGALKVVRVKPDSIVELILLDINVNDKVERHSVWENR